MQKVYRYHNLLVILLFVCLFFFGQSLCGQDEWDVDKTVSPQSKKNLPNQKFPEVKPCQFIFYRECGSKNMSYDFLTTDGLSGDISYTSSRKDSNIVIQVQFIKGAVFQSKVDYPRGNFNIAVVLGQDTAHFKVFRKPDTLILNYIDSIPLLSTTTPAILPKRVAWREFSQKTQGNEIRDFISYTTERFSGKVKFIILDDGFYPCIPGYSVTKKSIGRRHIANYTPHGIFTFFQCSDSMTVDTLNTLISTYETPKQNQGGTISF